VIERRQTTRYFLEATAQIVDLDSHAELVSVTRDLSLSGCFVKTTSTFPQGTKVGVLVTSSGTDFAARGKVTANITPEGMGIEFVLIFPSDQAVLEKWLGIRTVSFLEPSGERLIRAIPVTVTGQLSTGDFSEDTETRIVTADGALLALAAPVSPGQIVRLKNRLTHMEQACRVLFVTPAVEDQRKLLAVAFLNPVPHFWRIEPKP
jgi:PilZ domain